MDAQAVFTNMMDVINDAVDLASSAVKSAEHAQQQQRQPEPVTLVKVASSRYMVTAKLLLKSGAFKEYTLAGLTSTLESAGPAGQLDIMEKLASTAVFPFDSDLLEPEGDLVEKSASAREVTSGPVESKTELWSRCCSEAGLE